MDRDNINLPYFATAERSIGTHREASTHSVPAATFDFTLVPEVFNYGTCEVGGSSTTISPGRGFNIHRLMEHDP